MARIPYVEPEDLPEEKRWLVASLSEEEDREGKKHSLPSDELNVHKILANDVTLHEQFREFASAVWQSSDLVTHEREFVILTTAYRIGSAYEWQQHVRISLDEGIPIEQIRAISSGDLDRLAPEHAAIVEYVTAFVDGSVNDDVHDALATYYDDETILGIGMLAGLYIGFGRLIDAMAVELEVEFVGWDLENL